MLDHELEFLDTFVGVTAEFLDTFDGDAEVLEALNTFCAPIVTVGSCTDDAMDMTAGDTVAPPVTVGSWTERVAVTTAGVAVTLTGSGSITNTQAAKWSCRLCVAVMLPVALEVMRTADATNKQGWSTTSICSVHTLGLSVAIA